MSYRLPTLPHKDGFSVLITKINPKSGRILDSGVYASKNPTTQKDQVWMIHCGGENTIWTLYRCVADSHGQMVAIEEGRSELHSSKQKMDQLACWKETMERPPAKTVDDDDVLEFIDSLLIS